MDVRVQNTMDVNTFCSVNRHTVRLRYRADATALDFGTLFVGLSRSLEVEVSNVGCEILVVSDVSADSPAFTADPVSFSLAPGGSRILTVTFTPPSAEVFNGTLTIASNDPDSSALEIPLHGEGLVPPDIAVSPASLSADLDPGGTSASTLTIENTGGSDLLWRVSAGTAVVTLEDVLSALDRGFSSVTAAIPNRYDFSEGEFGYSIGDGGGDMYDYGNYLSTDLGGNLPYSDGAIASSPYLGSGGRYFTRKYPGLFVLVADLQGVSSFTIDGNLGANGGGSVNGSVLMASVGGASHRAFVKRVFGAGDPSVNHLVIVADGPGVTHEFSSYTGEDYHRVMGLSGTSRLYYLLYAGSDGSYIDDVATRGILESFFGLLGPAWLSMSPVSGTTPAGGSGDVSVTFDATGLCGDHDASIVIASNDPDEPEVMVPAHLHVVGVPDIRVAGAEVVVESTQNYSTYGALTTHALAIVSSPVSAGTFEVIADGDFAYFDDRATATSESWRIGTVGGTGSSCSPAGGVFPVDAGNLASLAADGVVNVSVQNTSYVAPYCSVNRHTVRLHYRAGLETLDFGALFAGLSRSLEVEVSNVGCEILEVSDVSADSPAFTADPVSFSLAPGGSRIVTVTFTPPSAEVFNGTLTIASNDPDSSALEISLHGEGLVPPDIAVSPASLSADLDPGGTSASTLTIENTGGSDLLWRVSAGAAVVTLEDVLSALDRGFSSVTAAIPNRYDFSEGEFGYSIGDGGGDMYDDGNYLGTNLGGSLPYSDGAIASSPYLGSGGRYFTRKYPGLFVLVADLQGVSSFTIDGNLGANGGGSVNGSVLMASVGGASHRAFVKRVFRTGDPSVNHLVIVADGPGVTHEFSSYTGEDYHRVMGLSGTSRLYYLLYAGSDGSYIDDVATRGILESFFGLLGPAWLSMSPVSGTTPAGGSGDVSVTFDATGLCGDHDASIVIASNDPDEPEVMVPAHLHVVGVPDIRVAGAEVVVESTQNYSTYGALTTHALAIASSPVSAGTFEVIADGDFAYSDDRATATAESWRIGTVGGTGSSCSPAGGVFPVDAGNLASLAADGVVNVSVQNTYYVSPYCSVNRHTVRLRYREGLGTLDFGALFAGLSRSLEVEVSNAGCEILVVSDVSADSPVFTVDPVSFSLASGDSRILTVTFTPTSAEVFNGTLTIASNDPDSSALEIPLHGEGLVPPDIAVSPASLSADLGPGGTSARTLTIENMGGSDLVWSVSAGAAVVLEDVLSTLDRGFSSVTAAIPSRYDFSEGEFGYSIGDGGGDMYDDGNYLGTNLGGSLPYSDGAIASSPYLGSGGRYFTRKYPGLFVLVADLQGVSSFSIDGNLGADGGGSVDGSVLVASVGGASHRAFVKRVFRTGDPSVNHLVIVADGPGVTHEFSSNTNDDHHRVMGLSGTSRLYYLLYAGSDGSYIDDVATRGILESFLGLVGPAWLSVSPVSGTTPAGGSGDVSVTFDATGLCGGDYDANIVIASNDPDEAEVIVPAHLHVVGVPDIRVAGAEVVVESTQDYFTYGALTTHALAIVSSPVSAGTFEVIADGDFAYSEDTATATAESWRIGTVGGTGLDCSPAGGVFPVDAGNLASLAADGVVNVSVQNTYYVSPYCSVNRHTVRLRYREGLGTLDFGALFAGLSRSLEVEVSNVGCEILVVSDVSADSPAFTADPVSFSLAPGDSRIVTVTFTPTSAEVFDGTLTIASDDPDSSALEIPLHGEGLVPPDIAVSPGSFSERLSVGQSVTRTLSIENHGGPPLSVHTSVREGNGGSARFFDDMEHGQNGWTVLASDDSWFQGSPAHSPTTAWQCCDVGDLPYDAGLESPPIDLRFAGVPIELEFYEWYVLETGYASCSLSGRSTNGAYFERLIDYRSAGWVRSAVNLDAFAGGILHLTFRCFASENPMFMTWRVDDVRVTAAATSWLEVEPESGVIAAGQSMAVAVTFDARSPMVGDHVASIVVASNDPDAPEVRIPAHLYVNGPPGRVYDKYVYQNPLRLDKSMLDPDHVVLRWAESCSPGAEDYGIYEGQLGNWYSHTFKTCTDAGADLEEEIAPESGDRYFLVVAENNNDEEGSYGLTFQRLLIPSEIERPQAPAAGRCRQNWNLTPCSP